MIKKKNAVVILATQPSNMGDLLINKSLTDNLSDYANVYIDDLNVPKTFSKYLFTKNVKSLSDFGFSFKNTSGIKFLGFNKIKFDYAFFSPGPSGGVLGLKGGMRALIILILLTVLRLKGVRLIQLGIDMRHYSYLDELLYKIKTKILGVRYFVRSKNNLKEIQKLGVKNVGHIPDMAFMHKRKLDKSVEKNSIGISFRDFENEQDNTFLVDRIDEIVKYYHPKKKIVFFYQVERDRAFTLKLFKRYKDLNNIIFRDEIVWYNNIPEYNAFDIVFSNRLHVLLLGFDYNAIPLALLNSNRKLSKIYNIFNDLELNEFILDLSKNHTNQFEFIATNKADLIKNQKRIYKEQQALSNSIFHSILN